MSTTPDSPLNIAAPGVRVTLLSLFVMIAIACAVLAWFMPRYRAGWLRQAERNSRNNFVNLGLALQNYADAKRRFLPPAVTRDEDGTPLYGWRVLAIDYAEGGPLFPFDHTQPWNSETNRHHCQKAIPIFHHPAVKNTDPWCTNYVAVTGPGTAFPDDGPISLDDITDGLSNTILLVEYGPSDIAWHEPRDLRIDKMSFVLNDPSKPSIGVKRYPGAYVVLADGRLTFLPQDTPPETLKALLTIAGGEEVELPGKQ